MDVRQLEYFLTIASRRSITAAAAELSVTQPTLTKSMRLLEQELGVPLFERLPRGVELTPYGQSLLRHAESVRVQLKDAIRELEGLRGGALGLVTVGAGPAWLRRHLPLAIARTVEANPAIRIRVDGGFDDALLRALREGRADFVVAELPSEEQLAGLATLPLSSDALGVCCRADHPLIAGQSRRRGAIALRELLRFPWIMPPRGTRAQRRLNALMVANDLPPVDPVVETESMALLLELLRRSDALTYTVRTTLRGIDSAGLVMLDVPELQASRDAGIITRKDSYLSPAALALIEQLQRICGEDPLN